MMFYHVLHRSSVHHLHKRPAIHPSIALLSYPSIHNCPITTTTAAINTASILSIDSAYTITACELCMHKNTCSAMHTTSSSKVLHVSISGTLTH
jgi:hypothetical protein